MLYNAPSGSTDPNAPYVGKNVAAGIQGSKVPPAAAEYPQREIVNLIAASGQSPTNGDLQQLTRGVRGGKLSYYPDIGAVNTPAIAPNPVHTSLFDGLHVRVKMGATPTGPSTLTVNGLVAPVKRRSGAALVGGEWAVGDVIDLVYSTTSGVGAFQLVGLTKSDVAAQIAAAQLTPPAVTDTSLWHIGTSTTGTATALATVLSPVPPAAVNGICMRVPITTTNGASPTLDFGFGPKPLVLNSTGAALTGGEMPGGVGYEADIEFDGTSARLINPQVSLATLYKAALTASAFTAGVVFTNIPSTNTDLIVQSVSITGASFIDAQGSCSFANQTTTVCGFTARLDLVGISPTGPYLGGAGTQASQIPTSVAGRWTGLNPSSTYTLNLVVNKNTAVQVYVNDTRILAYYGK